jgi:hypothetical protein
MLKRALLCIFVQTMEEHLWSSPLRVCDHPLWFSYYVATPRLDQHVSSFPVEQTSSLQLSLAFTFLVWLLSAPSCILSALSMPRLHGKPKRGPVWYQNKASMAIRPPHVLAPSPNSSPSSSAQSSPGQSDLPPLSSPWACRVEWFDLHGNSLGFSPGPIQDLASSSQPATTHRRTHLSTLSPCHHPPSPLPPPSVLAPLEETPAHWKSLRASNIHARIVLHVQEFTTQWRYCMNWCLLV